MEKVGRLVEECLVVVFKRYYYIAISVYCARLARTPEDAGTTTGDTQGRISLPPEVTMPPIPLLLKTAIRPNIKLVTTSYVGSITLTSLLPACTWHERHSRQAAAAARNMSVPAALCIFCLILYGLSLMDKASAQKELQQTGVYVRPWFSCPSCRSSP